MNNYTLPPNTMFHMLRRSTFSFVDHVRISISLLLNHHKEFSFPFPDGETVAQSSSYNLPPNYPVCVWAPQLWATWV